MHLNPSLQSNHPARQLILRSNPCSNPCNPNSNTHSRNMLRNSNPTGSNLMDSSPTGKRK